MTRKTGSVLLAFAIVIGVMLSACSGGGSATDDPAATPAPQDQEADGEGTPAPADPAPAPTEARDPASFTGEVVFQNVMYGSAGLAELWDKHMADFNKTYPNVKVRIVTDTVENLIAAGDPPDLIAWGWVNVPWIQDGLIEDLTAYMEKDGLDPAIYLDPVVGAQSYDGKLYALPWIADPNFPIAYNQKLFDQMGIDGVPPLGSLSDFMEFNKRFWVMNNGEYETVGVDPLNGFGSYIQLWTYAYMNGVDQHTVYNPETRKAGFNDPRIVEAFEAMMNFRRENIDLEALARLQSSLPAHPYNTMINDRQGFAMIVGSLAGVFLDANPNLQLAYSPMPDDALWLGGWGAALAAPGDNKEAAWELLKWMTSTQEGARSLGEQVGFIAALKENEWLAEKAQTDPLNQALQDILSKARKTLPVMPVDYVTEFNRLHPEVLNGQMSPKDFLDHMNKHVQDQIDAFYGG